ncbi:hypothetical protein DZE40_005209 [Clostridium beijerinckii]|nr:hypothetical protein [Clostridium beijerinckii]
MVGASTGVFAADSTSTASHTRGTQHQSGN